MKINFFIMPLIFIVFFSACSKKEDEIMVKAINFSLEEEKYKIELIAYDFNQTKESYTTYTFIDENFNKGFVSASNKFNLNLSVCDYIFFNSNIIEEKKTELVLNSLEEFSINSDANLVLSNDVNSSNFTDIKLQNTQITPIYSITREKDALNFILPILNKDLYVSSAVVINNEGSLSYLSNEELNIAIMLLANNQNYNYNFENSIYNASIKNSFANFNMKDNILNINAYIDIESRNGAHDTAISKDAFDIKLLYDIQAKIYDLYNDQVLRNALKLDWIEKQYNQEIEDIKVVVNKI